MGGCLSASATLLGATNSRPVTRRYLGAGATLARDYGYERRLAEMKAKDLREFRAAAQGDQPKLAAGRAPLAQLCRRVGRKLRARVASRVRRRTRKSTDAAGDPDPAEADRSIRD